MESKSTEQNFLLWRPAEWSALASLDTITARPVADPVGSSIAVAMAPSMLNGALERGYSANFRAFDEKDEISDLDPRTYGT